jgi:polysaccharide export outer membrane protein
MPGDEIAYTVVKVDDQVVATVLAQTPPLLNERFKKYTPPPDLKISVGDQLAVVIWEASPEGLFGYSMWDAASAQTGGIASSITGALSSASTLGVSSVLGPTTGIGGTASAVTGMASIGVQLASPQSSTQSQSQSVPFTSAFAAGLSPAVTPPTAQPQAAAAPPSTATGGAPSAAADPAALLKGVAQGQLPTTAQDLATLQNIVETGRPGTRIPVQEVGLDGAISVPYAGRVPAAGRTPNQVQQEIERRLAEKAVGPQALVIVQRSDANSVTVAGEIVGGKRVSLNPGGDRLMDVIAAAGGAQAPVHETFVQLSRDGVTASVSLASIVEHPEQNIFVRPGDAITLVQRPQTFSTFGAAGLNTSVTFNRDRLFLTEALAQSQGLLDNQADPGAVFLFRYEPDTVVRALGQPLATRAPQGISPVVYRLDLADPKAYLLAQQFPVHDKDIIFVADAAMQPVYRFVKALQLVIGPVITGLVTCRRAAC